MFVSMPRVALATLLLASPAHSSVCAPLASLDVEAYTGRWYQVYYNDLMKLFSSPDCSSALYLVNSSAALPTITVNNSGLGHTGKPVSYIGYAEQEDAKKAGELKLFLHGVPGTASYRICAVGEKTFMGKYHQYSIITDDTGFSLYVMARNVTNFFETYDADVQGTLSKLGYTGLFKPKKNRQQGCPSSIYYPPWP